MEQKKVCRRNIGVIAKIEGTGSIAVNPLTDQVYIQMAESVPMKRLGLPEEIAKAVAFLAIDATFHDGGRVSVRRRMVSTLKRGLSGRASWHRKRSSMTRLPVRN